MYVALCTARHDMGEQSPSFALHRPPMLGQVTSTIADLVRNWRGGRRVRRALDSPISPRTPIDSSPPARIDPGPGGGSGSGSSGPVYRMDGYFLFAPCIREAEADLLAAALREEIVPELPETHIRVACVEGSQRIGLWLRAPQTEAQAEGYDRALADDDLYAETGKFVFQGNEWLVRALAEKLWEAKDQSGQDVIPKRYTIEGVADPNGAAHITSYRISFESGRFVEGGAARPGKIITKARGYYDQSGWFDPKLTVTIEDSLSVTNGMVVVTTTGNIHADIDFLPDRHIDIGARAGQLSPGYQFITRLPRNLMSIDGSTIALHYSGVAVRETYISTFGTYEVQR